METASHAIREHRLRTLVCTARWLRRLRFLLQHAPERRSRTVCVPGTASADHRRGGGSRRDRGRCRTRRRECGGRRVSTADERPTPPRADAARRIRVLWRVRRTPVREEVSKGRLQTRVRRRGLRALVQCGLLLAALRSDRQVSPDVQRGPLRSGVREARRLREGVRGRKLSVSHHWQYGVQTSARQPSFAAVARLHASACA